MTFPFRARRRVTEGSGGAVALAAAAPGAWSTAPDAPFAGFWGQPTGGAITLINGSVLVAGGEDGRRNALADAALFEPAGTGAWTTLPSMWTGRRLHAAVRMKDGNVLFCGGIAGSLSLPTTPIASAEIYDAGTRSWLQIPAMAEPRFSHSASLLPDGQVLVAGGATLRSAQSHKALRTTEIYNPGTGQWTKGPDMTDARFGHPAVTLTDGRIMVVGGAITVGRGQYSSLAYCEVLTPDPVKPFWTPVPSLGTARKSHQAVVLSDDTVVAVGGDIAGQLLGWNFYPYSQSGIERLVPGGSWATAGDLWLGRSHHRMFTLTGDRILVLGGTDDATFDVGYRNSSVYNPASKAWDETTGMTVGRWAPAAAKLNDGRVLTVGGITLSGAAAPVIGEDVVTASTEIFTP